MRLHTKPLADSLEDYAQALDKKGVFPEPPEALGGKSLTELLNSGDLKFTVDKKYPQAFGIRQILEKTSMIGNFTWEVLKNPFDDSPFFTSDFPTTFEKTSDLRVLNRVVPLSPTIAVRVLPDLSIGEKQATRLFLRQVSPTASDIEPSRSNARESPNCSMRRNDRILLR